MGLINWDDSLSVNVARIDKQHQKLIALINDLSDAMKQGKGKEVLGDTVNGLISYTIEHFRTEETYFEKFGYSETASHKKEHANFVKKVSAFRDGFENGNSPLTVEVIEFLCNWLQNHIKSTDKKYSQLFNDKGLR